jgi:hypothetical protein
MVARVELSGAANRVQIHGTGILQRGERLRTHPTFADHGAYAISLDHVRLVRLFAKCSSSDLPR